MLTHRRTGLPVLIAIPLVGLLAASCGSNSPSGPVGGPVSGALDVHCKDADGGVLARAVGLCTTGGGEPDGGAPVEMAETLYNAEGDDDDCKYHVQWTSTPIRQNSDVTFTVTLTKLADMTPATGAGMHAEVYLSLTHPAAPPPEATESSGGKYAVGPIKFDMPGDWTVRFHFYEECDDAPEDSPHGHAAFYVRVPDPAATADAAAD